MPKNGGGKREVFIDSPLLRDPSINKEKGMIKLKLMAICLTSLLVTKGAHSDPTVFQCPSLKDVQNAIKENNLPINQANQFQSEPVVIGTDARVRYRIFINQGAEMLSSSNLVLQASAGPYTTGEGYGYFQCEYLTRDKSVPIFIKTADSSGKSYKQSKVNDRAGISVTCSYNNPRNCPIYCQ